MNIEFQRSLFRGSAWEYHSKRGQFYLHQFLIGQPDLNYREPLIVQEMEVSIFDIEYGRNTKEYR